MVVSDVIKTKQGEEITREFINHLSKHLDVLHIVRGTKTNLLNIKESMSDYDALLVTEALLGGIILNFVDYALSFDITLFVLCIDPYSYTSKGNYFLIRNGAVPVTHFQDILDHLT